MCLFFWTKHENDVKIKRKIITNSLLKTYQKHIRRLLITVTVTFTRKQKL